MFVLLLKYTQPLEEVERLMPDHQKFLDRFFREGKLIAAGPREPHTGAVILADVDSELEAMKIVVEDPFFDEKVAEYEVVRFNPARLDPRFAALASQAG